MTDPTGLVLVIFLIVVILFLCSCILHLLCENERENERMKARMGRIEVCSEVEQGYVDKKFERVNKVDRRVRNIEKVCSKLIKVISELDKKREQDTRELKNELSKRKQVEQIIYFLI